MGVLFVTLAANVTRAKRYLMRSVSMTHLFRSNALMNLPFPDLMNLPFPDLMNLPFPDPTNLFFPDPINLPFPDPIPMAMIHVWMRKMLFQQL
jgi:hypothetical protein